MVDSIPPSVNHIFPVESEIHATHFLLIPSYSNELGGNPLVPKTQEENPLIPLAQGGNPPVLMAQCGSYLVPMVPLPSSMVTSFDWSRLTRYRLPPYTPFQIIVQACNVPALA